MRPALASLVAVLVHAACVLPAPVEAQVDCSNPDNLCNGDPCVIPTMEVADPCVVDFGPRSVIIAGRLTAPVDGTLSISADTIDVQGNLRVPSTGALGSMSLTATDHIDVNGPIRMQGMGKGLVTLLAAGDITVNRPLRRSRVPNTIQNGGQLLVDAGGNIRVNAGIRGWSTPMLIAGGNIEVHKTCHADLDATGDILATRPLRGNSLVAGGSIELERTASVRAVQFLAEAGGTLTIRSLIVSADTATFHGAAGVTLEQPVRLNRSLFGNAIEASSSLGDVFVGGKLLPRNSDPASVTVTAAGNITVAAPVSLSDLGSSIVVSSTGGATAVHADLRTASAGKIRVEGASVQVDADLVAMGAGGEIRLNAHAGDMLLDGTFDARGFPGGIIEGSASNDITAAGSFKCAGTPEGCIALSAGGTLDTTGATFDKALSLDCPGSPSGAFLDPSAGSVD